jgi:hypothetical protein
MNVVGYRRPEDEEDPLAMPPLDAPAVEKANVLQADAASAGGGGATPPPPAAAAAPAAAAPPAAGGGGGGMVNAYGQPVPDRVVTTGGVSGSTTRTVASPETKQHMATMAEKQADVVRKGDEVERLSNPIREVQATAEEAQARVARETETKRAEQRVANQKAAALRAAQDEAGRKDVEAKSKVTDYWEDRGAPARVFSAFMVGLWRVGQALGNDGKTSGANGAYEVLKNEMAADRQKKMDALKNSKDYQELLRTNHAAAIAAEDKLANALDNEEITKTNVILKNLNAQVKRLGIPLAQAEYLKLRTSTEADNASRSADKSARYDKQVNSGHSTWSVQDSSSKAKADTGSTARQKAEEDAQNHDSLMDAAKAVGNEKALANVQKAILRQQKIDKGSVGLFKPIMQGAQIVGYEPMDVGSQLKTPAEREIWSRMATGFAAMARVMDPVGTINADSLTKGAEHLNVANSSPKELQERLRDFAGKAAARANASIPNWMELRRAATATTPLTPPAAPAAPAAPAPAPAPAARPATPSRTFPNASTATQQIAGAAAWLKNPKNRSNPNYAAVQRSYDQRVAQMKGAN